MDMDMFFYMVMDMDMFFYMVMDMVRDMNMDKNRDIDTGKKWT
jgi:hypothetical protein